MTQEVDLERALALCRESRLAEAERLLLRGIRTPPAGRARRMLAALYALQERFEEAIEILRPALGMVCDDVHAMNLWAVCHTLLLKFDEAAPLYAAALELDRSAPEIHANAAWNACLRGAPETNALIRGWLYSVLDGSPSVNEERSATPLTLADVTLCCVDMAYHRLAADALRRTLAGCKFADALFFSDRDCGVAGVRFVPVQRIASSADYSNFVIHRLREHVRTAFVLIIQYDGFVLNPSAWDPEFLSYDYIGAKMRTDSGFVVGNGGFSLRSRRLLDALRDDEEIRRYDAHLGPALEDVALCRTYRSRLESRHGIAFAPEAVADRFSAEHSTPTARNFGFHNALHLIGLWERGFRLPDSADDAVRMTFRARSELGTLAIARQVELRSREEVWNA